jgi:hypothetical protein
MINNCMNLSENIEKLRTAVLAEQREKLQNELSDLQKFYRAIIAEASSADVSGRTDEDESETGDMPQFYQDPSIMGAQQPGQMYTQPTKQGRRRVIKGKDQASSEDNTDTKEPFQKASAHHGLALTPQAVFGQEHVLTQYFDNPQTAEVEVTDEPTWQNVNQSIGNYMNTQLNNLIRQQRMLG